MRTWLQLALTLLLLAPGLASAKIYKWILPDGSVSYSDRPQVEGAQAVELPRLQTYSPPPTPPPATSAEQESESAAATTYDVFKVVSPAADEAIRDNAGTISVQLAIEPALRTGHVVEILLDGKAIGSGSASSASVSNVDRGTHTISATIKDGEGTVLANAGAVTFHLQRTSKLQPARRATPPPPS